MQQIPEKMSAEGEQPSSALKDSDETVRPCISQRLVLQYPEVGFARVKGRASSVLGFSGGAFSTFSRDGEPVAPIS
jgi:hypothetical protein